MDGVTVGHPCCNEHDCKTPLSKVTDTYCHLHSGLLETCAIEGCRNRARPKRRTCSLASHQKEEASRKRRKQKKANWTDGVDAEDIGRGRRLKGSFGRRWTHNEQLIVRPCGVVISRATFYASESMSAAKVRSSHHTFINCD